MIRRHCLAGAFVLILARCNRNSPAGQVAEPGLPDLASVTFDLKPVHGESGGQEWIAVYTSQGKTAKCRIELGLAEDHPAKSVHDFGFKSGEGRFVAEADSDSSVLLAELQKALEAKTLAKAAPRSSTLRFTFANLGEHLSRASGGGFNAIPAGDWTAMKIFLGEGEQEAEVFLNINPRIGRGQFSMKDPDYGDLVLAELAKVL